MIKIIFFDIDGTLRPFETGIIPETTLAAIERANAAGIITAIATGRHWMELKNENLIKGMRFDAFVTLDGEYCYVLDKAIVDKAISLDEHSHHTEEYVFDLSDQSEHFCYFDPLNGTCVQKIEIPKDQVQIVLDFCSKNHFSCLVEEERSIYANFISDELMKTLYEIKSGTPPVVDFSRTGDKPVFMLIPVMDYDNSIKMKDHLTGCEIVRWSDGLSFDLTRKGITKVSGIDSILRHYNFSLNEAAAVGDGLNDIGMLEHCHIGIAMGNAKEECKAVADYICPSIFDDGLSDAVDYIINYNRNHPA